jgi:IS30 family transposase
LARLARRWSPEQIAHSLRQQYPQDPAMQISHEAIYAYL